MAECPALPCLSLMFPRGNIRRSADPACFPGETSAAERCNETLSYRTLFALAGAPQLRKTPHHGA